MFDTNGLIAVLILALINAQFAVTENEYYSGLRKRPIRQMSNYDAYIQWKNGYDEQARRRFQQKRQQQQQQQQLHHLHQPDDTLTDDMLGPAFTYKLPVDVAPYDNDAMPPFAVGPGNPKYYEKLDTMATAQIDPYKGASGLDDWDNDAAGQVAGNDVPPFQMLGSDRLGSKLLTYGDVLQMDRDRTYDTSLAKDIYSRDDIRKMIENWANNRRLPTGDDALLQSSPEKLIADVDRQPVDLDSAWVIGVIAGISAAFTVGLLAIGIGWYTLQKKAKAAADVDYPAYGITGPNKDCSPSSGDRRLAQCAQMYHYQHQKQQIIAMENQHTEQNGSDIETDDENEEGDYTVYECPGLAPTGDMEVKNPLFLDDPTPVQKGTIIVRSNQSQKIPSRPDHVHQQPQSQFQFPQNDASAKSTKPANDN